MKKSILLGDKKYFELSIGKRILKKQLFNSEGTIPVYSGNVDVPFGFLDKSNIKDFEHDYIIWGIDDAHFDFGFISKGTKFATTDHIGAIKILDEWILPEYLLYVLKCKKRSLDFDWTNRPSLYVMRKVAVEIPVKSDGSFDIRLQRDIGKKFSMVQKVKSELKQVNEDLAETSIVVSEEEIGKYKTVCLGDKQLFKVDNGRRITKKDIEKAKGNIPVYSSSKFEDYVLGYVSDRISRIVKDAKSFDGMNLTVNADGSVGAVFVRKGKFYANDVCNVVSVVNPKIDLRFLRHELTAQIHMMGLDYSNKLYKTKLRGIEIRIPVDKNGDFDLRRQKEIADYHDQLNQTKNEILQDLEELDESFVII